MTTQPLDLFNPYSTASPLFTSTPTWMDEYDAQRVMSYQVYEQIYWTVPETFKLVARGAENMPIYVPTARVIVDTTNRYVGKGWSAVVDPDFGEKSAQDELRTQLIRLFRRERMASKFNSAKKFGIIRGDWIFHVIGNTAKPAGSRIKIETVDPASYFPIFHPDDPDRIIGVHLVEQIKVKDDWLIKRQTYARGADPVNNDGSDTTIYNSMGIFKPDAWQELGDKAVQILKPPTPLPTQITAIPLYHIKNRVNDGDPFGSSEIRGLERIMSAVNQAISDEELSLALEGLGVYSTDAGPPRREDGSIVPWAMGPGRVVERPKDSKFERVNGIGSVAPYQDHIGFLIAAIKEASSTPDIAIGNVDVSVAQSGISLALQMGPMIAKAEENDESIADTMDQWLHDITTMWLPAMEAITLNAMAYSDFAEKLPENRASKIQEVLDIVEAGIASTEWARTQLAELGFSFTADEAATLERELQIRAAAADPFAARAATEVDQDEGVGA